MADARIIRGSDGVVLSIFKEDWAAFLCYTSITITVDADIIDTRTANDGHWRKTAIHRVGWSMNLSGAVINTSIDDTDFAGFDFLRRLKGLTDVEVRCTFTDDSGNLRSTSGQAVVNNTTFTAGIDQPLKNDITLTGNGELKEYDGLIACDSAISSATITGLDDANGNIIVTPVFTGVAAQIKYRLDNKGVYVYGPIGLPIPFNGLTIDDHDLELIPVCGNGYEGDGYSTEFTINHGLTCAAAPIITLATNQKSATISFSSPAPNYRFRFDGGPWYKRLASQAVITWGNLQDSHELEVQAQCSNGAYGAKSSQTFTVPQIPGAAQITVNYTETPELEAISYADVYIDGVKIIHFSTTNSRVLTVNNGQQIRCVFLGHLVSPFRIRGMELKVTDTDTSVVLNDTIGFTPSTITYTFTANGDNFLIENTIGS